MTWHAKGSIRAILSQVEGGKRNPSLLYIWKLSQLLEVGMKDFFWLLELQGAPQKAVERAIAVVELVVLLLREEGREDLVEELFTRLEEVRQEQGKRGRAADTRAH